MKFKAIEELSRAPKSSQEFPRAKKKHLQKFLEDFMNSGEAYVEVIFSDHEYKNSKSCYSCMHIAARRSKQAIRVARIDGRVFLINLLLAR